MGCGCCRRCIPSTICGTDVSDLFAYSTTKYIKIRDARLGLLHYGLMFLIVVYILVYQLIGKLGYLKFNDAQNTVRLTLQEPTQNCNPNDADCQDRFSSLSSLPYCCAQNSSCSFNSDGSCSCDYRTSFKDYNCTWLGGSDASVTRESSIVVATFIHEYTQTLNNTCFSSYPSGANACDHLWIGDAEVQAFVRQQSDSAALQKQVVSAFMRQASDGCWSAQATASTCEGSPKTASPPSPAGLGRTSPGRDRIVAGVTRLSVTSSRRTTMSATQPSLAPRVVSRQLVAPVIQAGYRPSSPLPEPPRL